MIGGAASVAPFLSVKGQTMIRIHGFKRTYKGDRAIDWVEISSRSAISDTGETTSSTWHRIHHLRPREADAEDRNFRYNAQMAVWQHVEPAYEAWQAGQVLPEIGTPLAAWAGVTAETAEMLAQFQIRTVEDVRDMTDTMVQSVPVPGMRDLRKAAGEWLAGKGLADTTEKVAQLEAQLAAALEMLAERNEPGKRGPGRPRKTEAA